MPMPDPAMQMAVTPPAISPQRPMGGGVLPGGPPQGPQPGQNLNEIEQAMMQMLMSSPGPGAALQAIVGMLSQAAQPQMDQGPPPGMSGQSRDAGMMQQQLNVPTQMPMAPWRDQAMAPPFIPGM